MWLIRVNARRKEVHEESERPKEQFVPPVYKCRSLRVKEGCVRHQFLADLHPKARNNYFASFFICNISSNQILALRQSSILACTKVLH